MTHQVEEQYDVAFLRSHKYFLMNSLRRYMGVKNAMVLGHVGFLDMYKSEYLLLLFHPVAQAVSVFSLLSGAVCFHRITG